MGGGGPGDALAALRAAGERPERERESLAAHKEATPSDILQARPWSKRLKKTSELSARLRPTTIGLRDYPALRRHHGRRQLGGQRAISWRLPPQAT